MTRVRAAALALAAAVCSASCGAALMKLPSGPGSPAPDASASLDQATAACRRVSTISAEVAVSGSVRGHKVRGRLLAGVAAPDSVYIEAPAPFGAPVFVFGASHGDATLLLPRDRRVLEHGRPADVLEAITGVPLDPVELKSTLTGCAVRTGDAGQAKAYGEDWVVVDGEHLRYLHRDRPADPWRLVSVVRTGAGGWRADYRNFVDDLPRSVRLVSNEPRAFDLTLTLSQVDLNVTLEPSTFQVRIPPGTQPMSLGELQAAGPLPR